MTSKQLINYESLPKIIFMGLTVFFYMVTFERTVALIFVLNFAAGGLNASILLFLATMTGIFYTVAFNFVWPHSRKQLTISVTIGFLMILFSAATAPLIALFAAVIFQIAIAPVLVHYLQVLKKGFTASAILGVVIQITARSLLDTSTYYVTTFGLFLLFLINVIWFGYWLLMNRRIEHDEILADLPLTSTSSVFAFLIIQILFLGSPSMMSTWFLRSYFFTVLAAMLGLLIGWYILNDNKLRSILDHNIAEWIIFGLYILSMVVVIWSSNQYLAIPFILIAQATAIYLLHKGIRVGVNSRILDLGRKKAGIQFLIILGTFFVIGAPFWTAMPLSFIMEHNDKGLMFFVSILLPFSAVRSLFREDV
ncbi:MAG: hypothetical protein ACXAD7_21505 [Candidatus Kariarchaeaceae archaeon]|jgi:hypothetical protein